MMSGGFDVSWASPSINTNARRDVMVGSRGLAFLERWYRPDAEATDPLISPVFGDFAGLPPLLFQTGDTEVLRDDSVRAAERARTAGVSVRLEVYPMAPHAWHQLATWLPETRAGLQQIKRFAGVDSGWKTLPQSDSPVRQQMPSNLRSSQ
jgi:acetyl esterase/lipase